MTNRFVTTAAFSFTALVAGCGVELTVPTGAPIGCSEDSECPDGWSCKLTLNRCVRVDRGSDLTPPAVTDVSLSSDRVSLADDLVVSFTVTEEVIGDPVVSVDSRELALRAVDGLSYTYAYSASGIESETTTAVLVSMLDLAGNEAIDLTLGAVTFDFTSPQIADFAVDAEWLRAGDDVVVSFRVSEELADPPVVTLAGVSLVAETGTEPPLATPQPAAIPRVRPMSWLAS